MKKLIFIIILFLSACSPKLIVIKSSNHYFLSTCLFYRANWRDHVEVVNLTENSGDAHHFEPVMQDQLR